MLKVYIDASGKRDQPAFVVAGYVATVDQWSNFEREWSAALAGAGVPAFHATDFFGFHREFVTWKNDRAKHDRFAKRFGAIAERQTDAGVGRGVDLVAYERIIARAGFAMHRPQGRFPALVFCGSTLLHYIATEPRYQGQPIDVLFEQGDGVTDLIAYLEWCKKLGEQWLDAIGTFGIGDKGIMPLQAADLLAHELWRHLKEKLHPTGRRRRRILTRLLQRNRVHFAIGTEKEMVALVPRVLRFQREQGLV
jgi:hypothetical protein